MSSAALSRGLTRGVIWCLIGGAVLVLSSFGSRSWSSGLLGLALLGGAGWVIYQRNQAARPLEPWPWPPDFRAQAEAMARTIDPTPKRILPPDEKSAIVAKVAVNSNELARLIADKPPAWPYAVFTSVLLQRRNTVKARLRQCVSGYQPKPGTAPLSGQAYSQLAYRTMTDIADLVTQLEQFMLSPAFTGTVGRPGDDSAVDADAIMSIANRLMDYHGQFLTHAERCTQTPVQPDVRVLVQDMGAFTLCPLMGFDRFIETMCARVGEAQDLLPYTKGGEVVALDDVSLAMSLPDGLTDRITAQINRFNQA
jgi:hypothetical protein